MDYSLLRQKGNKQDTDIRKKGEKGKEKKRKPGGKHMIMKWNELDEKYT